VNVFHTVLVGVSVDVQEKRDLVAERARATFNAIRELRKTAPQFTRQQREDLAEGIKKLQDCWWEDVRHLFAKEGNG